MPVPCTLRVLRRWEGPVLHTGCAKDFQELGRLPCLQLPDCSYPVHRRTSDTSAAGLGEAHADVVLKVLKLATDAAYTDSFQRKLLEWYAAAPKSDRYAPAHEDYDGEVSEAGKGGKGVRAECQRCLPWTYQQLQPDFEAKEDRQT